MRVFISIPQNGRVDGEVEAEKRSIMEWAANLFAQECGESPDKIQFIDSYIQEGCVLEGDRCGVWYLGESLKRMAAADLVVFATGADKARGCKIEMEVCKAYGIPFRFR